VERTRSTPPEPLADISKAPLKRIKSLSVAKPTHKLGWTDACWAQSMDERMEISGGRSAGCGANQARARCVWCVGRSSAQSMERVSVGVAGGINRGGRDRAARRQQKSVACGARIAVEMRGSERVALMVRSACVGRASPRNADGRGRIWCKEVVRAERRLRARAPRRRHWRGRGPVERRAVQRDVRVEVAA